MTVGTQYRCANCAHPLNDSEKIATGTIEVYECQRCSDVTGFDTKTHTVRLQCRSKAVYERLQDTSSDIVATPESPVTLPPEVYDGIENRLTPPDWKLISRVITRGNEQDTYDTDDTSERTVLYGQTVEITQEIYEAFKRSLPVSDNSKRIAIGTVSFTFSSD